MPESTILDFYRKEMEHDRADQYTRFTVEGRTVWSTEKFFSATAALAAALEELGVRHGDRVVLIANNRPEWHVADLAILDLGAVDVPFYPNLTPEQVAYQVEDSGATVAIAEDGEQMEKLLHARERVPGLEHLIQIDGPADDDVLTLEELLGGPRGPGAENRFWERAREVRPADLATIVYTSGTTGRPKGVMLSHRNFTSNVEAFIPRVPVTAEDLALELLPLCHVFERTGGYAYMYAGCRRAYCATAVVGEVIAEVAPTGFASVPRLFEKIHATIMSRVEGAPATRRKLFAWAVDTGWKVARLRLEGSNPGPLLGLQHGLADRLVLSKIRAALGGRVRFCISGGAPLAGSLNRFFHSIGISIQEAYGLTETSPGISISGAAPGENRLGAVGKALHNLEVKLAPDGELLVRGPSVFSGYWNNPEATAEAFDEDGFFRTGDIARIDEDGFIWITDRKKDLIVTAGGKNIAPQPIENELKKSPWIDNAVLIGDRRPYVVALLSPAAEELQTWAARRGMAGRELAELLAEPAVQGLFSEAVERVNGSLARFEQIKKFRVIPMPLSVEGGHLTPTLKVKRRVVEQELAGLIEELYQ
ncbi:MAG: long-chain fatty acid--CoA ligase [Acidobacteria bacterium]|nr:long-chain fatty acid--CoA ligase [Acidobacteriota bacterium]